MGFIFELVGKPLGLLMSLIFSLVNNYLLTIFLFTFLVRLILFPIYMKQQKSSLDRARLAPRLERLQKKYGNDRQKLMQKQQELYDRHGVKMTGGCLPMLLSMLVLFGVIGVIYSPLTKLDIVPEPVSMISKQAIIEYRIEGGLEGDNLKQFKMDLSGYYGELRVMTYVNTYEEEEYKAKYGDVVRNKIIDKIENPSYTDLNYGLKLTGDNKITKEEFLTHNAADPDLENNNYSKYLEYYKKTYLVDDDGNALGDNAGDYFYNEMYVMSEQFTIGSMNFLKNPWNEKGFGGINILWLIPLISGASAFLVSFISTRYSKRSMPNQPGSGCMTGGMMIYMPAISLFIAFGVPGAVGIYWIMSNLFSIIQTVVLNKMYDPAKARAEAEKELQVRRRKKQEDKKRLAAARQREEAEARKAEQALERQREESREMNKKKKKKGSSGTNTHKEETNEGATDAVDTQPEENTDTDESAE